MIRAPSRRRRVCRPLHPFSPSTIPQARPRSEVIPVTVKAFNELAVTAVAELKKGVAFVVEGRLAYYKNPDTNREVYSIVAERFLDITAPKSTAVKLA
jgi:single-stranded DNA-binding protein